MSETVALSSQLSAATEPDTNAKSRGAVGTSSRRSTRIDANKRRAAMVDRVAKSVKRELKLLGSELQAWQQPKDPQQTARIQRECVKHGHPCTAKLQRELPASRTAGRSSTLIALNAALFRSFTSASATFFWTVVLEKVG